MGMVIRPSSRWGRLRTVVSVDADLPGGVVHEAQDGEAGRLSGDGEGLVFGEPLLDFDVGGDLVLWRWSVGWVVLVFGSWVGSGFGVGCVEHANLRQALLDEGVVCADGRVFVGAFESGAGLEDGDLRGDDVFFVAGLPEEPGSERDELRWRRGESRRRGCGTLFCGPSRAHDCGGA